VDLEAEVHQEQVKGLGKAVLLAAEEAVEVECKQRSAFIRFELIFTNITRSLACYPCLGG
jgi:hypothetical protein